MHKKLKSSTFILVPFILIIILFSSLINRTNSIECFKRNNVNIVLDSSRTSNTLPKNFRKTTDLTAIKNDKSLNINGLNKLNISGSQQFSVNNLPTLIKSIGTSLPITVVDLRQEAHGFINEFAVSWADEKNNANAGLTKNQVLLDEAAKLKNIKLNSPITFYNHPKKVILPTKIQDENEFVKSNYLSYSRIPVRDGGIPADDMVDYFIDFVKNKPKNSWIHFHCKYGIGRTVTFMIMYDMIKNYNEVSSDDIIKRQLALGNYDEHQIKSFYNNERMRFLKSFYEYCKENGESLNLKWSEWEKTSSTSYIKNPVVPKKLYVVSKDSMTPSEKAMIASLQGIVNSRSFSQIYTLDSKQPNYKVWLDDLNRNHKISYKIISNPWQLLNIYKNYIDGYVLYSNKTPKDPSINNACSLASLNKSIVVDESIESKIRISGITKIKGDCRNTDENWAYNNLWNNGLNHSLVIQLSPDKSGPLRDYAIMTKSLVFYEDSINKTTLRDKIFSSMDNNAICLGWGPDEFFNVSTASKYGISMVASDWSYNLTTLSAFPSQKIIKEPSLTIPQKGNFHYVTFLMSDGDNQQWTLGTNYNSTKWFGYPGRDKLNLGWSMSPSLYYLAPTVFNLYYKSISNEKTYNNFIVAPSGNGYIYPSKFDKGKLNTYIDTLNDYMQNVNEKYVSIIDKLAFNNINLWNKFTKKNNIQGLFYLDYDKHNKFQGKILWSNNKPIVSCRDLLWNNIEEEDELVRNINDRVNLGQVNACDPLSYTFVYVHAWSKNVQNVEDVINKLRQNPNVKVVTPEAFMELIKNNIKH